MFSFKTAKFVKIEIDIERRNGKRTKQMLYETHVNSH